MGRGHFFIEIDLYLFHLSTYAFFS
jgi:hypothetical protein